MILPRIRKVMVKITKITEKLISSFWCEAWIWLGIADNMVEFEIWENDRLLF